MCNNIGGMRACACVCEERKTPAESYGDLVDKHKPTRYDALNVSVLLLFNFLYLSPLPVLPVSRLCWLCVWRWLFKQINRQV